MVVGLAYMADSTATSGWLIGWRALAFIAFTSSALFTILLYVSAPESPRYLILQERYAEALAEITKVANKNNKEINSIQLRADPPPPRGNVGQLFSRAKYLNRPIYRITLAIALNWFAASFTYYGLSLNAGNLGGNFYTNLAVSLSVDIPSYLVTGLLLDKFGRRVTLGTSMITGAVFCLSFLILPSSLARVAAFLGKFAIGVSFTSVYVFTAELFPTTHRSTGFGVANAAARLAGILAPQTVLVRPHVPTPRTQH